MSSDSLPARERPNQRWTVEEENALKAGIAKHGFGKWQAIISDPDPEIGPILAARTNVDLKDKWRNMRPKDKKSGGKRRRPSGPPTVTDPSLFQQQPVTQMPTRYSGEAGPAPQFGSLGGDPQMLGFSSMSAPGPPMLLQAAGARGLHSTELHGDAGAPALLHQQLLQLQQQQQQSQQQHYAGGLPPLSGGLGSLSLQPGFGPQQYAQQRLGMGPQSLLTLGVGSGGLGSGFGGVSAGSLGSSLGSSLPLAAALLQQQQQQLALGLGDAAQLRLPGGSGISRRGPPPGLAEEAPLGLGSAGLPAASACATILFGAQLPGSAAANVPGGNPFGLPAGHFGPILGASAAAFGEQHGGLAPQGGFAPSLAPVAASLSLMSPLVRAHSAPAPKLSGGSSGARPATTGGSPLLGPLMRMQSAEPLHGNVGVGEAGRQRSVGSSILGRDQLRSARRQRSGSIPGHRRPPPLHEACAAVDAAAVVAALAAAEDVGARSSEGRTALHALAAGVRSALQAAAGRAIAAALVQAGLQVDAADAAGATPLHVAASPAAVELLLAAGASPRATNNAGTLSAAPPQLVNWETPLFAATERAALGVVDALVGRGGRAAIDQQTDCGETALICACSRVRLAQAGLLLLEAGASVSPRDAAGRQALHAAAEAGVAPLVAALLAAGADAAAVDASGDSPMQLAVLGNHSAVQALLRARLSGGGGGGGGGGRDIVSGGGGGS